MKRNEVHPIISLVTGEPSDQCMRRVLAFHLGAGWRIKQATTAHPAAVPEKFEMRDDIDPDQTVMGAGEPGPEQIAVEFVLEPSRRLIHEGAHARTLRIGMSSIECSLGEHPVEIWLIKENKARAQASLRAISEDLRPAWATLAPSHYRGPSIAEARQREAPPYVVLQDVFVSSALLAEAEPVAGRSGVETTPWRGGFFYSGDGTSIGRALWPIFKKWAYTHAPAAS